MVKRQLIPKPTQTKLRKSFIVHAPIVEKKETKLKRHKPLSIIHKSRIKYNALRKMVKQFSENLEDRNVKAQEKNNWFIGPLPAKSVLNSAVRFKLHPIFTTHIQLPKLPCEMRSRSGKKIGVIDSVEGGYELTLAAEIDVKELREETLFSHPAFCKYISL